MKKPKILNADIFRYNFNDQDFLKESAKANVIKAYIVGIIFFIFGIIMLPVDWLRYQDGQFSASNPKAIYIQVSFAFHLILLCTIIPAFMIYKNREKIENDNFPQLDNLLISVIFMAGLSLVVLSIMGMGDRGSIMGYAAYIIIVNHFFSINGPRRLAINLFCLTTLVIGVFLVKEDITLRYIYIMEGIGVTLPSFLVANLQMQIRYKNFNNNRRLEEQNQLIQAHNKDLTIKSLQGQMNPHFIFNTLNSIQHFMLCRDQKTSMNYLSQFAKLIRSIFKYSSQNFITLENEIEFLTLYLNLETLRFENKIKANFTVDPILQIKAHEIYLPPLLIQPLIENTFKHGLMHLEENGTLDIHFFKKGTCFYCSIEDNGVGRKAAIRYKDWLYDNTTVEDHESALHIIQKRLEIFNEMIPSETGPVNQLKIEDLTDPSGAPSGTHVSLTLCLETQDKIYKKQEKEKIALLEESRKKVTHNL